MSTFKTYTTAQTAVLLSNAPIVTGGLTNGVSINTIAITNSDATLDSCLVEVFIDPTEDGSSNIPIMKVDIPKNATAVYDTPFSMMEPGELKITTSNDSDITVIIN